MSGSIGGQFLGAAAKKKQAKAEGQAINNAKNFAVGSINSSTDAQVGTLTPWVQPGLQANNATADLLGVGGDPAAAQSAFQNYLGSTGYNFRLKQGTDAVTGSAAAKGLLNSGATAKALTGYGQNLGSAEFSNYLGQLGTVAQRGAGASSDIANAYGNQGRALANIYTGTGTQMASANALGAGAYLQAGKDAADNIVKAAGSMLTM